MKFPDNSESLFQTNDNAVEWGFEDDDPGGEAVETPEEEPDEEDEPEFFEIDQYADGDADLELESIALADDGTASTESLWEDTVDDRDQRLREEDRDPDYKEVREHVRSHNIVSDLADRLSNLGERRAEATADEGDLLDMRNTIRRLFGDLGVDDYWRREVTRPGERIAVGLSIDLSGSMTADELDAKAAAGAFLFAVEQSGGEVVANAWKEQAREAEIYLVTNPWEPFQWRHLDTTDAGGGTPTAGGVYEAGMLLQETRLDDKLLVVITDGRPSSISRDIGASTAAEEAEQTIEELRNMGQTVLGVGIGNVSEDQLAEIFGEEKARKASLDELPETLIECYEAHHESAMSGPASGVTI